MLTYVDYRPGWRLIGTAFWSCTCICAQLLRCASNVLQSTKQTINKAIVIKFPLFYESGLLAFAVLCKIVQVYVEQWTSSSNDLGVSRHCPACFSAFTLWNTWRNFKFIANKGPSCDSYPECDMAKHVKSAWRSWSKNKNTNNTLNIPHCPALCCLNKE